MDNSNQEVNDIDQENKVRDLNFVFKENKFNNLF